MPLPTWTRHPTLFWLYAEVSTLALKFSGSDLPSRILPLEASSQRCKLSYWSARLAVFVPRLPSLRSLLTASVQWAQACRLTGSPTQWTESPARGPRAPSCLLRGGATCHGPGCTRDGHRDNHDSWIGAAVLRARQARALRPARAAVTSLAVSTSWSPLVPSRFVLKSESSARWHSVLSPQNGLVTVAVRSSGATIIIIGSCRSTAQPEAPGRVCRCCSVAPPSLCNSKPIRAEFKPHDSNCRVFQRPLEVIQDNLNNCSKLERLSKKLKALIYLFQTHKSSSRAYRCRPR